MWTESSSVNSANLVNISATILEIKFFLGGYFFGAPCTRSILQATEKPALFIPEL